MSRRIASYWLTGLAWLHCVCGTVTNLGVGVGFAAEYGTPALSVETPAKHEVHSQQTYDEASSSKVEDIFTLLERETMLSQRYRHRGRWIFIAEPTAVSSNSR